MFAVQQQKGCEVLFAAEILTILFYLLDILFLSIIVMYIQVFVDLVGLIDPVVVVVVAIVVVVAAAAAAADIVVVVVVVVGKYAAVKLYFNMCQCVYCVCLWM